MTVLDAGRASKLPNSAGSFPRGHGMGVAIFGRGADRERGPSDTARNGLGRRDRAVRPSRRDPHDGGSGSPSGGGTAQAEEQQREQRPGGPCQDLCCVCEPSKPGRHHPADEAKPDQTDCDSHPPILPGHAIAIEMPRCRARAVHVDVREMSTPVTLCEGSQPGRSSTLYQANLTRRVDPPTGGPRRTHRRTSTSI
jgi:hypothetical protein